MRNLYFKHLFAIFCVLIFIPIASVYANQESTLPKLTALTPQNTVNLLSPTNEVLAPSFDSQSSQLSAFVKKKPVVQKLTKEQFRSDEDVTLLVNNTQNDDLVVEVVDVDGEKADVSIEQKKTVNQVTVAIAPRTQFRPGKYKLIVSDHEGFRSEQDFRWGVLALNTNRSIYLPGQIADLSIAVLDDRGDMVCDANVVLTIKNKTQNTTTTLSTDNGKVATNEQCTSHNFSLEPDYEATYPVGESGTYEVTLTAKTKNGLFTITDKFLVANTVPFDVERISATRIYPANDYPVELKVTAQEDFEGTITETVPDSFTITPSGENNSYDKTETLYLEKKDDPAQSITQDVQGASTSALLLPFAGAYSITQGFGTIKTEDILSRFYNTYGLSGHDGIDFGLPENTPLFAVDDGNVVLAEEGDYGITVVIQHSWGRSYYGHLNKVTITKDTSISKGAQIGFSGNTGESTGPHLHFGIKPIEPDMNNGYYGKVDPLPYFNILPTASLATNLNAVITDSNVLGASTSGSLLLSSDATSSAEKQFSVSENQFRQNANFDSRISENDKVKIIQWHVSLKKGQQTTLNYTFKAPLISPQFYLLGPLSFYKSDHPTAFPVFQESRQWQIASDAVGVDWYNYDWQYRKQVTIDHTKVGGGAGDPWCNDTTGVTCDTNWTSRKKITFNNSASGINLTSFPVLVKLNSTRIDYSETQNAGQDIRFVDPSDNTTVLSHEIETWNESGTSVVWVNVPQLNASSTTDYIWIYYNNPSAAAQSDPAGLWSAYKSVWHYKENPATTCSGTAEYCDSTSNANNGNANGSMTAADQVTGQIGFGMDLDGTNDYIDIPHSTSLQNSATAMTFSTWAFWRGGTPFDVIMEKGNDDLADSYSWQIQDATPDKQYFEFNDSGGTLRSFVESSGSVTLNQWMYLTVVIDDANNDVFFYKNGVQTFSNLNFTNALNTTYTFPLWVGRQHLTGNDSWYNGILDEMRIIGAARPADWVEAEYLTTTDAMNTYGAEENQGGASLSTFPVLINQTTDVNLAANAQSDADDILFTDSTGTVKLAHEIEKYTSATGELIAWVTIPTLSAADDTIIYLYYGNASVTTQQNPTAVWDSNYEGVWHLKETPTVTCSTTFEFCDSTSNNADGDTFNLAAGAQQAGKIDGSIHFDGINDYIEVPTITNSISTFTVQAWINPDVVPLDGITRSFFCTDSSCGNYYFQVADKELVCGFNGFSNIHTTSGWNPTAGTWYHVACTFNTTTNRMKIYSNGVQILDEAETGTPTSQNNVWMSNTGGGSEVWDGYMDEGRISVIDRNVDWFATEYNNQNSPSTFYTLGEVETQAFAPTNDELMRHGRWFNGGSNSTIQPFVF